MEWLFASWRILCNKYQIYIWALAFLRRPGGVEVKQIFTEACSCTRISRLRLQEKEETKVWLGLPKGRNISLAWYHLAANLFPCHYHQEYPWSWGMIIKFSELFKEPGYTPKLLVYSSLKSFPPHSTKNTTYHLGLDPFRAHLCCYSAAPKAAFSPQM